MHELRFSRRTFFVFLIAGVFLFAIWLFRRIDSASAVEQYFALNRDHRAVIGRRFQILRNRNPVLYRDSILFFGLSAIHAEALLDKRLRRRVLSNWIDFLFDDRTVSWPYVNYPEVGKFQICNGLIREIS
jgi:hypothetical protein